MRNKISSRIVARDLLIQLGAVAGMLIALPACSTQKQSCLSPQDQSALVDRLIKENEESFLKSLTRRHLKLKELESARVLYAPYPEEGKKASSPFWRTNEVRVEKGQSLLAGAQGEKAFVTGFESVHERMGDAPPFNRPALPQTAAGLGELETWVEDGEGTLHLLSFAPRNRNVKARLCGCQWCSAPPVTWIGRKQPRDCSTPSGAAPSYYPINETKKFQALYKVPTGQKVGDPIELSYPQKELVDSAQRNCPPPP